MTQAQTLQSLQGQFQYALLLDQALEAIY